MVSAEQIAELFSRFARGYKQWVEAELAHSGTTPARARVLAVLMCHGPSKMSDLSRHLDVTPRNVTKLVDGLEAEGLVRREGHPEDRRATLIAITPAGMEASKESFLKSAATQQLFNELTPDDRDQLYRVLNKLLEILHRRIESAPTT